VHKEGFKGPKITDLGVKRDKKALNLMLDCSINCGFFDNFNSQTKPYFEDFIAHFMKMHKMPYFDRLIAYFTENAQNVLF